MARTDILERKQDILLWISQNQSKAFICKELHCKQETLNSYLKKLDIEYNGNKSGKGIKTDNKYKTAIEYAQNTNVKSFVLKQKLIRDGLKENKCELCGVSKWMGVYLPLELHHKDGNHFNNTLDNFQILCPNCHSIQIGNAGSNIGKYVGVSELAQETDLESVGKQLVGSNPISDTKRVCYYMFALAKIVVGYTQSSAEANL